MKNTLKTVHTLGLYLYVQKCIIQLLTKLMRSVSDVISYAIIIQLIQMGRYTLNDQFTAMLDVWVQSSPNPTWSELIEALRSPDIINRPDFAAEIEDKYIKSDDSSVQESKDTAGE